MFPSSIPLILRASVALALLLGVPVTAGAAIATTAVPATPVEQPAQLVLWNHVITTFRASIGSIGTMHPAERVERAQTRIALLDTVALGAPVRIQPMRMQDLDGVVISVDGHLLFGLTEADLDVPAGETLDQAASLAASRLRVAFDARIEQRRPQVILRGVLTMLGASAVLVLILFALSRLSRRALAGVDGLRLARVPSIGGLDTRPAARACLRSVVTLPIWLARLGMLHLWLTVVLAAFPYTRPWSHALGGYLLGLLGDIGVGIARSLPGLTMVLIVVVITRALDRLMTAFFRSIADGRLPVTWLYPETAQVTRRISSLLLWLFALTIAYPYLPGSGSTAFQGVSVFAGLLLTLGSAGLVNQVMSGLVLIYSRSMKVGDFVQLGEVVGTVTEIGILSTKVRTTKDEEVTLPNAALVGGSVTNYSRLAGAYGAMISATVTIGYDAPWRQVHALLRLAAERTPGLRRDSEPIVMQRALSDFAVEYELRCRIDDPHQRFAILSELHGRIQDAFNEHGVQIMSPHFEAQPTQPVGVARERWYQPPARPDAEPPPGRLDALPTPAA